MCEMCLCKADSWILFDGAGDNSYPQWHLSKATCDSDIMKTGDFCLVIQNDPEVIFDFVPIKDQFKNFDDNNFDQIISLTDEQTKHSDEFSELRFKFQDQFSMSPINGYLLILAAKANGYDEKENFATFLIDKMAITLDRKPDYPWIEY